MTDKEKLNQVEKLVKDALVDMYTQGWKDGVFATINKLRKNESKSQEIIEEGAAHD